MKHYVTLPGSFQETSNLQPALECNRIFRQKKKRKKEKNSTPFNFNHVRQVKKKIKKKIIIK